jgi:Fis family transcriptional regulator
MIPRGKMMMENLQITRQITLTELMQCLNNKNSDDQDATAPKQLLRQSVEMAMESYFAKLDNASASNIYQMVLTEVEIPLIKTVLRYTRFNRLQAAKILGISRTTFHKKLKQYGLDLWLENEKRLPLA